MICHPAGLGLDRERTQYTLQYHQALQHTLHIHECTSKTEERHASGEHGRAHDHRLLLVQA